MEASPLWATFRSWPVWIQVLGWLLVWPVLVGLFTLTKPAGQRRGWWVLTGASALVWVGAATGGEDEPESEETVQAVDQAAADDGDGDGDGDG